MHTWAAAAGKSGLGVVAVVGVPDEVGAAETCAVETGIIIPGATPGSIGGALQETTSKSNHYLPKAQSVYANWLKQPILCTAPLHFTLTFLIY